MTGKTQTYVEFFIPGMLFAESETRKVAARDISKLKVPDYAFGFQFFDITTAVVEGEKLEGDAKNHSKRYLIAEEVLTAAEAIKRHADKDSLVSNIRGNRYKHICQTKQRNFQPVDKDTVVVNSKMQVIWGTEERGEKPKPARAPKGQFRKSAAPEGKIVLSKPIKLKTSGGPQ